MSSPCCVPRAVTSAANLAMPCNLGILNDANAVRNHAKGLPITLTPLGKYSRDALNIKRGQPITITYGLLVFFDSANVWSQTINPYLCW